MVGLYNLLIGAEGTKILENANAFPSCGVNSMKLIQCPVGVWFRGDPAGARFSEEARRNTHEPLVPGAEINRHV
ncbi:hypothetical protein QE429_003902 [Bacillus sp. SORGH_AS 510]|nr:hypothetical protein [Bacillus sp. SORGH_AS_0510]